MSRYSLWEKEAFDWNYDLTVVGAGITGLSTAYFYKKEHPNARVLILERESLPQGASTRNAGFACIGSISEHKADLDRTSEEEVKQRIKRRFKGLELLKSTLGEEAIGYEQCGGYELFTSAEKFEESAQHITLFNGWLNDLVGEKSVYSEGDLNGYPVIKNRLEGALHPGKMMRSLIQKVQHAGAEIRWNEEVEEIKADGKVITAGGAEYESERVLVACNGFGRQLLPNLEILPARGFILVSEPIEELPWRGTFHHDRGYIYFRNVGDRLLLGGARNIAEEEEETTQFGINMKIRDYLIRFAREVLNLPKGWRVEREWSGIMGFTPTKTPHIKHVEGRLHVAAGLSGMGIAIGMRVGQEAATMLR